MLKTLNQPVVLLIGALTLSGCYRFVEPPPIQGEMVRMADTEFGQFIRQHVEDIPDTKQTRELRADILSNPRVHVVSDDFLIHQRQSKEDSAWELVMMTKDDHHLVFCDFMEHQSVEIPEGAPARADKGTQTDSLLASGSPENLKRFVLSLSATAPDACLTLPFADAPEAEASQ
ncbi:hypothetical protein HBA54_17950 [Pelagibius litoralis]|uniref:Lipoprotein n=1 Tax=Pelagibius litoralis TaxID=374515 RepID=A0A967K8J2_9PROT|nr:hypothetical protein [Pelagibius litoralis]NIA70483.1 hypothetical protein [Pelagibius litoralis]